MRPGSNTSVLCAALLCCAVALGLAGRSLDEPGLYYDEVIQAGPALDFLREDGEPLRIPGARAARVFDRWLPWMTQPYMGALKSQLLIPVFALAQPDASLLRATTLAWALLGIPLVMLFANRALGLGVALSTGALLAVDPSLLFVARHDWGSFSIGFLLRCATLLLVYSGWQHRSRPRLAAAGVCLGLGLYNKIDFGVFVAAAALALLLTAPRELLRGLRERRREVPALAVGLGIGALPLLLAAGGALSVASAAASAAPRPGALAEKLLVMRSVLDGSYFQRLMLAGGRFEDLGSVSEATAGIGFLVFLAAAAVIVAVRRVPSLRGEGDHTAVFLVAAAALTLVGILATPGAFRAHHFLNAYPLPQLVIATACALLFTRGARPRAAARAVAILMLSTVLVSGLRIDADTLRTLRETGGRGRWSHAVEELARELASDVRPVSLDWGLDGPLRFVAPELAATEPVWRLRARTPTELRGTPQHVYLVMEPEYAVFPFGGALLEAIAALPADRVRVEHHSDRSGAPVLRSIRFDAPHTLVYHRGRFEVKLPRAAPPGA